MTLFSQHWLDAYVDELAADRDFPEAARWFNGRVALRCGDEGAWFEIAGGRVVQAGLGHTPAALFTLSGSEAAWQELFSPRTVNGTINRLFRHGKIHIDGDMVQVMFFWKMLFWLTEVGDRVPQLVAA
jgi:hypothetical protein